MEETDVFILAFGVYDTTVKTVIVVPKYFIGTLMTKA